MLSGSPAWGGGGVRSNNDARERGHFSGKVHALERGGGPLCTEALGHRAAGQ